MKIRRKLYDCRERSKTLRTGGAFAKAYERNQADHYNVVNAMCDAGRGHWKDAEVRAAAANGDALSIAQLQLQQESLSLGMWAEEFFRKAPYLVYPERYR